MIVKDSVIIITDVDGVLTDGGIYIGSKGEMFKRFSVKDGSAIVKWLDNKGDLAWLTSRSSVMVEERASELGVNNVFQNITDKASQVEIICDTLGYSLDETVYVGDAYSDVKALEIAAVGVTPADAMCAAKDSATHVLNTCGGNGVIYELVRKILS